MRIVSAPAAASRLLPDAGTLARARSLAQRYPDLATPTLSRAPALDAHAGGRVFVLDESTQATGSFTLGRGTSAGAGTAGKA